MTGSKGPDKNGVTAAPSAEMEDSLRASMALKTDHLWQLKCRCNVCAQEEPHGAAGGEVSEADVMGRNLFPRELCLLCTWHIDLFLVPCVFPVQTEMKQYF